MTDVTCRVHAGNPAATICARCGDFICTVCRVRAEDGTENCASCASHLAGLTALLTGVPWENRKKLGFFKAAYQTTRMVMRDPRRFYRTMPVNKEYGDPLLFVLLMRGTGTAFAQLGFAGFYLILALSTQEPQFAIQSGTQFIATPFAYIGAVFNAFMMAALCHLALMLMTPRHGFHGTFRVNAYAAAVDILQAIPLFGAFAAWVWSIYLHMIGFEEVHGVTQLRALLAALAPTILGFFIAFVLLGVVLVIFLVSGF